MEKNDKIEIIRHSNNRKYSLIKYDDMYVFSDNSQNTLQPILTPGGTLLDTSYIELANRILNDLEKYGPMYMLAESILPWHYTMVENFSKMGHKEVESMLNDCFLKNDDWTFCSCEDDDWTRVFGTRSKRVKEIRKWLSKCSHMQMTGACCIGNAYQSINIAYVLASIMENSAGTSREKQFKALANLIAKHSLYGTASEIMPDFINFDMYYGIHLNEEGALINDPSIKFEAKTNTTTNQICFEASAEQLIGRNYYHYTNGKRDEKQLLTIEHDLSECICLENGDVWDEGLEEYIPFDCWVKKINVSDDEDESHYIVALETKDGKVVGTTVLLDRISRMGGGMFFVPGMELAENHNYEEIEPDDCDAVADEIDLLKKGRYLSSDFSFIGKRLPEEIIENEKLNDSDTEYTLYLQSAYRLAYVDLLVDTDENGVIEDFSDYATYQSTGSSYGDMFTRPHSIDDMNEEAIDVLLYIIDKYTDEEYNHLVRKHPS